MLRVTALLLAQTSLQCSFEINGDPRIVLLSQSSRLRNLLSVVIYQQRQENPVEPAESAENLCGRRDFEENFRWLTLCGNSIRFLPKVSHPVDVAVNPALHQFLSSHVATG